MEGLPENAFLNRAELPQRAIAATVRNRGTRLEPVRTYDVEDKVQRQLGPVHVAVMISSRRRILPPSRLISSDPSQPGVSLMITREVPGLPAR
jgi:hypothetical protein